MNYRRAMPFLLALAAVPALAQASKPEAAYHRLELKPPGGEGQPLPYTIEVPQGWQVRQQKDLPGIWLGPADAKIPDDPRLVYVRISPKPLGDAEAVAANIKANAAKQTAWTAPRVEVKDLEGTRGVLVRMDSGEGEAARSTLVLKMPFDQWALDFMASAGRAEFDQRLPEYERILLSVRPVKK